MNPEENFETSMFGDRIHKSLEKKISEWLEFIELRNQINELEMFILV